MLLIGFLYYRIKKDQEWDRILENYKQPVENDDEINFA